MGSMAGASTLVEQARRWSGCSAFELAAPRCGARCWAGSPRLAEPQGRVRGGIGLFLGLIGLYETGIVTSGASGMPPAALSAPGGLLRAPEVPLIGRPH
jgi:hypothetical protein